MPCFVRDVVTTCRHCLVTSVARCIFEYSGRKTIAIRTPSEGTYHRFSSRQAPPSKANSSDFLITRSTGGFGDAFLMRTYERFNIGYEWVRDLKSRRWQLDVANNDEGSAFAREARKQEKRPLLQHADRKGDDVLCPQGVRASVLSINYCGDIGATRSVAS